MKDPYRVLFPFGLVSAVLGILLWPLAAHHGIEFYPRQIHGQLLFFAFLWSFVAGFLMTAVPRMTASPPARRWEVLTAAALVVGQWVLNFSNLADWASAFNGVQTLFLIGFVGTRFWQRRQLPFEGFIFMPFAFLCALTGAFGTNAALPHQAFVLNLILGVGARLIPVISRMPNALAPAERSMKRWPEFMLFAVLLNATFASEWLGWFDPRWSSTFRAVIIAVYALRHFRFLEKPVARSFVGWGLRVSVLMIVIGNLAVWITPFALGAQHLIFIGGFTLVTLMVATRVTLAHGGQSLDRELKERWPLFLTLSLVTAAIVRLFIVPGIEQKSLLDTASGFFLIAIGIWVAKLLRFLWARP